jgi:hypothetical protein
VVNTLSDYAGVLMLLETNIGGGNPGKVGEYGTRGDGGEGGPAGPGLKIGGRTWWHLGCKLLLSFCSDTRTTGCPVAEI